MGEPDIRNYYGIEGKFLGNVKNIPSKPNLSELAQKIKDEIITSSNCRPVPNEFQLNSYLNLLYKERDLRPGLSQFAKTPPYVHRLSNNQIYERTSHHSRASSIIAETVAAEFSSAVYPAYKEMKNAKIDSETVDIFLWTARNAYERTPIEFQKLPENERISLFSAWLDKHRKLLSDSAVSRTADELLDYSSNRMIDIRISKNMTADKISDLAQMFDIPIEDSLLEQFEENYEPLMPALVSAYESVYNMANPYYREYDINSIQKVAELSSIPSANGEKLKSDIMLDNILSDDKSLPLLNFKTIQSNVEYKKKARIYANSPTTGWISACFDSWVRDKFSKNHIEIYSLSDPEHAITDMDVCTSYLEKGETLAITNFEKSPVFIRANSETGQISEQPDLLFSDLTNPVFSKFILTDYAADATSPGFRITSGDSDTFKNFNKNLRDFIKSENSRDMIEKSSNLVASASEYIKSVYSSDKSFDDKTHFRINVSNKLINQLQYVAGIDKLTEKGIIRNDNSPAALQNIYNSVKQRHESRQIPRMFSVDYNRAYKAEFDFLCKIDLNLKEINNTKSEFKTVQSKSDDNGMHTDTHPIDSHEAQSEIKENSDLARRLLGDLQNDSKAPENSVPDDTELSSVKSIEK